MNGAFLWLPRALPFSGLRLLALSASVPVIHPDTAVLAAESVEEAYVHPMPRSNEPPMRRENETS